MGDKPSSIPIKVFLHLIVLVSVTLMIYEYKFAFVLIDNTLLGLLIMSNEIVMDNYFFRHSVQML